MLTHVGSQTIETERLVLRKFAYSDDEAMLRYWVADEEIQSLYSEPTYRTKEEVKGLLDKYISGYNTPNYYRWAIILKESDECGFTYEGTLRDFFYMDGQYVDRLYYSILRSEFDIKS